MDVTVGIDRRKVLNEVNKLTAFTARQIDGSFDKISATTDEEKIVLSYLEQARSELISKMSTFSPVVAEPVLPV